MRWTDQQMDNIIANMLRAGVMTAAAIVLLGGVMYLFQHPGAAPSYSVFHGEVAQLRDPVGIVKTALQGHARSIIQFGLLLLIATPIVRVFLCVVGFFSQRDRLYVAVSLIVLCVLLYSVIFGH
uniref:DUF1634 domain-containing protein n=1 Tax=Acidobacterium capsulatum TaxID=33075 RepID=A0A7V4XUT3_9BACT